MEFKQANIFEEHELISTKIVAKNTPKTEKTIVKNKKLEVLKNKIKILYEFYEQLYEKQNINLLENREIIIKGNIISYPQDRQAEPKELIKLTIYDIDKRIEKMKEILSLRTYK